MSDAAGSRGARWRVALRAAWDLTRFWALVRARPRALERWQVDPGPRLAPGEERRQQASRPGDPGARRIVAIVGRVAHMHPLRPACLEQALASCAALRRRGIAARVRLGVRRGDASGLVAHAWVEVEGLPAEPDTGAYHALDRPARVVPASARSTGAP